MSLAATTWALGSAPVADPTRLLVLLALADRAHDDGTSAWPSQAWLAYHARCSNRTVRRHIKALEADGIIYRGNQSLVERFRADHRPVVWNLDMSQGGCPEFRRTSAAARC